MATPVLHDASTDIVRAQLFLFLVDLPLAFAKTASLDISVAEVDISNKMLGDWEAVFSGKKGFTISAESLLTRKTGQMSYDKMLDLVISGEPIDFYLGDALVTNSTNTGGEFAKDPSKKNYTGKVIITSLNLTSAVGEIVSVSASLKGVGALVPVEPVTTP